MKQELTNEVKVDRRIGNADFYEKRETLLKSPKEREVLMLQKAVGWVEVDVKCASGEVT